MQIVWKQCDNEEDDNDDNDSNGNDKTKSKQYNTGNMNSNNNNETIWNNSLILVIPKGIITINVLRKH